MKVLFVGNSHTYFNDMPYIFAYLCAAKGVCVQPTMLTRGGECLENHAKSEQVLFNIRYGEYDLCVLQEVESAFPGAEVYGQSVMKLLEYANAAKLPVGLYENFAPEGKPERQDKGRPCFRPVRQALPGGGPVLYGSAPRLARGLVPGGIVPDPLPAGPFRAGAARPHRALGQPGGGTDAGNGAKAPADRHGDIKKTVPQENELFK